MITVLTQTPLTVADLSQGGAEVECQVFDLAVDLSTLEADLAQYDPTSATSPSVTIARKYARVLLDAYAASKGQGA
jgi:hypothetical protein